MGIYNSVTVGDSRRVATEKLQGHYSEVIIIAAAFVGFDFTRSDVAVLVTDWTRLRYGVTTWDRGSGGLNWVTWITDPREAWLMFAETMDNRA